MGSWGSAGRPRRWGWNPGRGHPKDWLRAGRTAGGAGEGSSPPCGAPACRQSPEPPSGPSAGLWFQGGHALCPAPSQTSAGCLAALGGPRPPPPSRSQSSGLSLRRPTAPLPRSRSQSSGLSSRKEGVDAGPGDSNQIQEPRGWPPAELGCCFGLGVGEDEDPSLCWGAGGERRRASLVSH